MDSTILQNYSKIPKFNVSRETCNDLESLVGMIQKKNSEINNPVLTFDGKKYNMNDLPIEIKEIIKGLQIAETQVKMYEDTLKLLSIGRNTLANQLREKLKSYN